MKSAEFLAFSGSKLMQNLFTLFDTNGDMQLNFREFLIGFAIFQNETFDHQIKASFKLFDPEERGYVSVVELKELLLDALRYLAKIDVDTVLPKGFLDSVLEETLRQARESDKISRRNHELASAIPNSAMPRGAEEISNGAKNTVLSPSYPLYLTSERQPGEALESGDGPAAYLE